MTLRHVQSQKGSIDGRPWDALIVGAGPAGAIASLELARRKLRVLLVDKRIFPRDKVCGCCLNSRVLRLLNSIGLGELPGTLGAVPVMAFRLSGNDRTAVLPLPKGCAISRSRLDAALVAAAVNAGARFECGIAAGVGVPGSGLVHVALRGAQGNFAVQARVVICAAGLAGVTSLGEKSGNVEFVDGRSRIGAAQIVDASLATIPEGIIHMAVAKHGYVGSVRLEDGRLNVAAALDRTRVRQVGIHRTVQEVLDKSGSPINGLVAESWNGTQPLTRRLRNPAWERTFAIGDAAGYVQPFTGEGIAWAIDSALAVVPFAIETCQNWRPSLIEDWRRTYRKQLESRQDLCRLMAWSLGRPPVFNAVIWALTVWPRLAGPFIKHMNRSADPVGEGTA